MHEWQEYHHISEWRSSGHGVHIFNPYAISNSNHPNLELIEEKFSDFLLNLLSQRHIKIDLFLANSNDQNISKNIIDMIKKKAYHASMLILMT